MKTSDRVILKGYYWNHDAIRKDMARLQHVIDHFNTYKAADFKRIADWFNYHAECILSHHHGEDGYFFPIMRERKPAFSEKIDSMEHEHIALDASLEKMKALFARLAAGEEASADEFKSMAADYMNLVVSHLDKEEPIVEGAVNGIPVTEVLQVEQAYIKKVPRSEMSKVMPWMVDAMDDKDRKFFFGHVPKIVKWIYNLSAKRKFNRLVDF